MSDQMIPMDFGRLLGHLLREFRRERCLMGVPVNRSFPGGMSPIGPAAGPHTQLAGNIVAAYGAGASHFELKTVQILEGEALGIEKPCILTRKEVYNTEWSTELTVAQAFAEYVHAYLLIHLLNLEFGLGSPSSFAFIMSVGYDLAGICSEKMDGFIEGMKNAAETDAWKEAMAYVRDNPQLFERLKMADLDRISPCICDTITLSTMHGCRAQEIEAIASYLLREKKLHTYVKLNPTLLGEETVRRVLDGAGYGDITYSDEIFRTDLAYDQAIELIGNLTVQATQAQRLFGVKLTNTFPILSTNRELGTETMYMSGPVLYPMAIGVAAKLAWDVGPDLRISYSGGADEKHIAKILETGIYPVTVSSLLLKQGGYSHLTGMNDRIDPGRLPKQVDVRGLTLLAEEALQDEGCSKQPPLYFKRQMPYSVLCAKCRNCVDVCPNRANERRIIDGRAYVVHHDSLCNECGNCIGFCIAGHQPYKEKWTLFDREDLFEASTNPGACIDAQGNIIRRRGTAEADSVEKALAAAYASDWLQ